MKCYKITTKEDKNIIIRTNRAEIVNGVSGADNPTTKALLGQDFGDVKKRILPDSRVKFLKDYMI